MHLSNFKTLTLALSISLICTSFVTVEASSRTYHARTTVSRNYVVADPLLQTGRYEQAEDKYAEMLNHSPGNLKVKGALALAQAERFKLDAAENNAKSVLAKDPQNAMAYVALGAAARNRIASLDMTYRSQRDAYLAQSVDNLQKALQIAPDFPEAHNQLGITYRFQGRYDLADQEFAQALRLDPAFAEALVNQGVMDFTRGDFNSAERNYRRAIQRNSHNPIAHYRLGETLLAKDQIHEAISSFNTALALDPHNAAVMSEMAKAYQAQGNSPAAIAYYRKAIQQNPSMMGAYTGIANIYDSRGDGEMAMAELRSALNINPQYSEARNQLGQLALSVDKPDQAVNYYKENLSHNPHDPEALKGLSQALTSIAQKSAVSGQTMGVDSDIVDAEQDINQALKYNPNDLRLHLAALRIGQLSGRPQASSQELQRIIATPAQNDADKMIQGEALFASGQYAKSDEVFTGLMQSAAHDPNQLLLIGDTLKTNGDLANARRAYRMALNDSPTSLKAQRGIHRIEMTEAQADKSLRLAKALNNWRQRSSSVDFYEQTLKANPRQPQARLALAKLYEKEHQYDKAAMSYQHYVGLIPEMTERDRKYYQKKIDRLETLAHNNQTMPQSISQTH